MMTKIQGEGLENKDGVNEGPTTPRPAPPKGHAPEANSEGRAEPGQVEWPPPSVEWPPPSLETSGLRPPAPNSRAGQGWGRLAKYYIDNDTIKSFGKPGDPTRPHHCIFADWGYGGGGIGCMHPSRNIDTECLPENCPFVKTPQPAPSEDEERLLRNQWRAEHERYPAEGSEVEGKKWGKLWLDLLQDGDTIDSHAARFRDECIAPYENFARIVANITGMSSPSTACEDIAAIRKAYTDLPFPDQGEATKDKPLLSDEEVAQAFHEAYERLAPEFGYKTRDASAKPWADVPENNKRLMLATVAAIRARLERK